MRARGYILVETMVALLVLTLVLGGVLVAVSGSVRRQQASLETRRALMVAQSELAGVGVLIPGEPSVSTGMADDIAWRVQIDPAAAPGPLGLLARVTVSAGAPGAPPRVRLSELRIFPPTARSR